MKWWITEIIKKVGLYSVARWSWRTYDRYHFLRRWKEKNFFSQFMHSGNLVFDIGACYGDKTKIFRKLGARVVAVEPAKDSIRILKSEFKNDPNVRVVARGVSQKSGIAHLAICVDEPAIATLSENWKRNSRFANKFNWEETEKIQVTTLNALIRTYGVPVFCKIDVEGYEYFVLKGLTKKIDTISFEFHKELLSETRKCLSHLSTLGKIQCNYTKYDSMQLELPKWISYKKFYTHLQTHPDTYLWGDIYVRSNL